MVKLFKLVIVIGEGDGGCTADHAFFENII